MSMRLKEPSTLGLVLAFILTAITPVLPLAYATPCLCFWLGYVVAFACILRGQDVQNNLADSQHLELWMAVAKAFPPMAVVV